MVSLENSIKHYKKKAQFLPKYRRGRDTSQFIFVEFRTCPRLWRAKNEATYMSF